MPLAASASASAYYMLMTLYEKHNNNCSVSPQSELLPDWQYEFAIISGLCFRLFFVFLDKKP